MSDSCEMIMQEYGRALDAIDEILARRPGAWPRVRPVQWDGEAIQIDTGGEAIQLRREEARLVGLLAQLEDSYRGLGGDVDDLHRLAGSRP